MTIKGLFTKVAPKPAGQRLYEWRFESGKIYGEPRYAKNACYFRLQSLRTGKVITGGSGQSLYIHVSSTGEQVQTTIKDGYCYLPDEGSQKFRI